MENIIIHLEKFVLFFPVSSQACCKLCLSICWLVFIWYIGACLLKTTVLKIFKWNWQKLFCSSSSSLKIDFFALFYSIMNSISLISLYFLNVFGSMKEGSYIERFTDAFFSFLISIHWS